MVEFREDPYRVRYDLPKLKLDATDDDGIWVVATEGYWGNMAECQLAT